MSKKYNIVHISTSPVVGQPGKVVKMLSLSGHNAVHIALNDYQGPLANKFLDNSILYTKENSSFIAQRISEAEIIHIQNLLPNAWAQKLLSYNPKAHYVYQAHSPLREGPLHFSRNDSFGINFSAKLIMALAQPRMHPDSIPVPTITIEPICVHPIESSDMVRVLYSPTHKHKGRWNGKYTEGLVETLTALDEENRIKAIFITDPITPSALFELRKTCHISIDEISSGGFHQVSLEGLCAGNVVINNADFFSRAMFAQFCDKILPPFITANQFNIYDVLCDLISNKQKLREQQLASHEFAKNHMHPLKLVTYYEDIYDSLF